MRQRLETRGERVEAKVYGQSELQNPVLFRGFLQFRPREGGSKADLWTGRIDEWGRLELSKVGGKEWKSFGRNKVGDAW